MRLIHTADVHLDTCFAGPGLPAGFGNRRRQSLRDVFHAILRRAAEWPADAVLIAGDLFEHDRVTRDTVAYLLDECEAAAPVPIFIAPGNHDPYTPDSPYAVETWPENVVVFDTPDWQAHDLKEAPLTIHGFGFDGPDLSSNPFGELRVPLDDGRVHVAVAHGSERGHLPAGKEAYGPFTAEEAAPPGLAYLALGHFHTVTPIDGDFTATVYYSGAPEGRSFKEAGIRHYLEVEFDNGRPVVRAVPSSRTLYANHTFDAGTLTHAQQLVDILRGLASSTEAAQVLRVTLTGSCPEALRRALPAVQDAVKDVLEHVEIIDDTDAPEDYGALAREETSLGLFIRQTTEEIRDATDEARGRLLRRAREVGLAAYRGQSPPIHGIEEGG